MIYSEYNAWLQPKSRLHPYKVNVRNNGADDFFVSELMLGLSRIYGESQVNNADEVDLLLKVDSGTDADSFVISQNPLTITGGGTGILYGIYRFINRLSMGEDIRNITEESKPSVQYRVINHWDNIDGRIERGYSGKSIFFKDGKLAYSVDRITDYARLLASVGINAISINNVNVTNESAALIMHPKLDEVAVLAGIFRKFGIRLLLSVHFDSPVILGGLKTSDPLDEKVIEWWKNQAAVVYECIPDFLGFLVKADSEFRMGPASHGRTQADGANTLAAAVEPFGGKIFWRCFVYNCQQDWRDEKTDRPMAAYENFQPLDGKFASNVILQIKFGPVDFQVREPLSPLFSSLRDTPEAVEYQITQEYTGHQIDLYGLPVQMREILDTEVDKGKTLQSLLGGSICSSCAVGNIGNDNNWTGHALAQCNFYAFGRMSWNPGLSAEQVIDEWVKLTFEASPGAQETIKSLIVRSRNIYEKYTSPLGIGFMVMRHTHYGPDIEGYEYSRWGTYHRANWEAVGVDRTSNGTGYTKQYPDYLREMFDNIDTCPEDLLLFFHRVRYDHRLKNGKTLLQHIYNSHFEGVDEVSGMIEQWRGLEGQIPDETYRSVLDRFERQLMNANEWRDVINTYFYRKTGVKDEKGRLIYQ